MFICCIAKNTKIKLTSAPLHAVIMSWYCGNETTIGEVWVKSGLNPCLYNTIVTGILFGVAGVFGAFEIILYRRYSTPSHAIPRRSCLYILQLLLTVTLVLQPIVRAILLDLVLYSKHIAGYQIIGAVLQSIAWILSITLICLERKRLLPSIPTRGHGLVLLLLWTFAFGLENVVLISWRSSLWWWTDRE